MELRDTRPEVHVLSSTPCDTELRITRPCPSKHLDSGGGRYDYNSGKCQAGQGVENKEASFLGEKLGPEGFIWICSNSEELWDRGKDMDKTVRTLAH